MRLLIVEDEPKTATLLESALRQEGYEVVWAQDEATGLHEAIKGGFDAFIADVMLPKIDELNMVRAFRAQEDNTPVLMLSARGDASHGPQVEGSGLGLSIAHSIAQTHGGALTMEVTPDERTCMFLRLPAA